MSMFRRYIIRVSFKNWPFSQNVDCIAESEHAALTEIARSFSGEYSKLEIVAILKP